MQTTNRIILHIIEKWATQHFLMTAINLIKSRIKHLKEKLLKN